MLLCHSCPIQHQHKLRVASSTSVHFPCPWWRQNTKKKKKTLTQTINHNVTVQGDWCIQTPAPTLPRNHKLVLLGLTKSLMWTQERRMAPQGRRIASELISGGFPSPAELAGLYAGLAKWNSICLGWRAVVPLVKVARQGGEQMRSPRCQQDVIMTGFLWKYAVLFTKANPSLIQWRLPPLQQQLASDSSSAVFWHFLC